jgi:predicted CopG family antitoxin
MPQDGWKTVALPDAVYARLEAKAKREKRSVSNMALVIIEEGLKE